MKNRIYKIKDKILVQGNENELTKDEVLVKEENGSVVLKERINGEVKSIAGAEKGKSIFLRYTEELSSHVYVIASTIKFYTMINNHNKISIGLSGELVEEGIDKNNIIAIEVNPEIKLAFADNDNNLIIGTISEMLKSFNLLDYFEQLVQTNQITEEEYYNIEI